MADVPKKEGESQEGSTKDGSVKNSAAESSTSCVSSNAEQDVNSDNQDAALDDGKLYWSVNLMRFTSLSQNIAFPLPVMLWW